MLVLQSLRRLTLERLALLAEQFDDHRVKCLLDQVVRFRRGGFVQLDLPRGLVYLCLQKHLLLFFFPLRVHG